MFRLACLGIFFLGLSMVACGCAKVGPDYVRPSTALSMNWQDSGDQRVRSDPPGDRSWWKVFEDPVLDRIIDLAYGGNLSLRQAGVRVLEARAQLGIAVGNLYPQTQQAGGSLTFNRPSERSFQAAAVQSSRRQAEQSQPDDNDDKIRPAASGQPSEDLTYWQDQVNFNIAWEIDFWGRFRRAIESADAGLHAAVADYDSALVSLTADAASSYIQIRVLEKRLAIALENVKTQKEGLQIAEARFTGGVTSLRDVEQSKTLLYGTQSTVSTLQAQLRQTQNALCVLLGLAPENLDSIMTEPRGIPTPPPQVAVGIPADLLRRRPDISRAEYQAMAQSAQIGVARGELFPKFSLTGSFGFLATDLGRFSLSDMATPAAGNVSVGPSIQWNFLNYGRITNNVRVQDARFQELLLAYQNAVLTAQKEVEDSLTGFLRAQENAEYLALSADAAKKSMELAFVQYQQGVTDFTTVLLAQQDLLRAQDSFASALGNISMNLVGLYRALGGGWQMREGHELVPFEIQQAMNKRTNWGKLLSTSGYMPPASSSRGLIPRPDW